MPDIWVSDEVWNEIAKRGKFGETEDDVLRRFFKLHARPPTNKISHPRTRSSARKRRHIATQRQSTYVQNGRLIISYEGGARQEFQLPGRENKLELRRVRTEAVAYGKENLATVGQINAILKALTEAGYHLTK